VLPCFQTGRVWVVDTDRMALLAVEDTGRGPSGIATSVRHNKIYVGNYAEDTLTIIDATPGAPTQYRSIMRLGKLRIVGN
jgi:DNA-binding beta-propeller fold protein YncE